MIQNVWFSFLYLTVGYRLGPAGVTRRVVIHKVKVNLSHNPIKFSTSLTIAGKKIVHHTLSTNQIVAAEKTIGHSLYGLIQQI